MNYISINSSGRLRNYLDLLESQKISLIALDLEAESNRHSYGEKLCLVQVFDGTRAALIDPFNIETEILKSFFENRNILKIMYDASSDLSLLKNTLDIEINSILDLRPAVTLLQYEKQDLHSVISSVLGISLENKNKFQKYNWVTRPIARPALTYALNDVLYLIKLKDSLLKKLTENNLLDSYILRNLKIQNKDYTRDPERLYRRIKGWEKLEEEQKEIARKITDVIEKYSALYNMPSYQVFNKDIIGEVIRDPARLEEVRLPKRFSTDSIENFLNEIRLVINNGRVTAPGLSQNSLPV